jgi:hypothetical protein
LPLEVPAVLMQVGVPCLQQAESERGSEGELRRDQRAALSQPARDYSLLRGRKEIANRQRDCAVAQAFVSVWEHSHERSDRDGSIW